MMTADALAIIVGGMIVLAVVVDIAALRSWVNRLRRSRGLPYSKAAAAF
jgi:hypothetical protein